MKYDLNQIPSELKNTHQWIVWKSEVRNGKSTKVPYQANGEMAQSNNRRSWSTFHTAARTYINGGYECQTLHVQLVPLGSYPLCYSS